MNNYNQLINNDIKPTFSLAPDLPECKSCGHQRQEHEHTLSWACPACGVSYGISQVAHDDTTGHFYATRLRVTATTALSQSANTATRPTKSNTNKRNLLSYFSVMVFSVCLLFSVIGYLEQHSNITEQQLPKSNSGQKTLHLLNEKDTLAER